MGAGEVGVTHCPDSVMGVTIPVVGVDTRTALTSLLASPYQSPTSVLQGVIRQHVVPVRLYICIPSS